VLLQHNKTSINNKLISFLATMMTTLLSINTGGRMTAFSFELTFEMEALIGKLSNFNCRIHRHKAACRDRPELAEGEGQFHKKYQHA
jgi:hypothetical protein